MNRQKAIEIGKKEIKLCGNQLGYFQDNPAVSKEVKEFQREQTEIIIKKKEALQILIQEPKIDEGKIIRLIEKIGNGLYKSMKAKTTNVYQVNKYKLATAIATSKEVMGD